MWVGGLNFVEAVPSAVRTIACARIIVDDPSRWAVLRLVNDEAAGERASRTARMMVQAEYSVAGAIGSIAPLSRKRGTRGLFCSQLIAEAYAKAGVTLVADCRPAKVTPAKLQFHSILTRIKPPLSKVPSDQIETAKQFLDRDEAYVDSPRHRETLVAQAIFEVVRRQMRKLARPEIPNIQLPPRNLNELLNVLAFDTSPSAAHISDMILEEFQARDFFSLWVAPYETLREAIAANVSYSQEVDLDERRAIYRDLEPEALQYARDRNDRNTRNVSENYVRMRHPLWLALIEAHDAIGVEIAKISDLLSKIDLTKP